MNTTRTDGVSAHRRISPSTPFTSNRHRLRAATAACHSQLETVVGSLRTIQDYRRYLRGSLAFRAPIENNLRAVTWPETFGSWRPTEIADLIARDLDDVAGTDKTRAQIDMRGDVSFDTPKLLGTLYVLEGSALGARLLLRDAGRLDLSAEHGAAHLACQASSDTWRTFVDIVDGVSDAMMPSVITAANETFEAAKSAFMEIDDAE